MAATVRPRGQQDCPASHALTMLHAPRASLRPLWMPLPGCVPGVTVRAVTTTRRVARLRAPTSPPPLPPPSPPRPPPQSRPALRAPASAGPDLPSVSWRTRRGALPQHAASAADGARPAASDDVIIGHVVYWADAEATLTQRQRAKRRPQRPGRATGTDNAHAPAAAAAAAAATAAAAAAAATAAAAAAAACRGEAACADNAKQKRHSARQQRECSTAPRWSRTTHRPRGRRSAGSGARAAANRFRVRHSAETRRRRRRRRRCFPEANPHGGRAGRRAGARRGPHAAVQGAAGQPLQ